jgi:hypothetical protein
MKKLIIISILFLTACSASDSDYNYSCGEITIIHKNVHPTGCEDGYGVTFIINNNIAKFECINEQQYNSLSIGDTYCETIYTIYP